MYYILDCYVLYFKVAIKKEKINIAIYGTHRCVY